jgi:hypothetical protein
MAPFHMSTKTFIRIPLLAVLTIPLSAINNAAWLARMEGVYMSYDNPTPFGRIGFAIDMVKGPLRSIHGRTQSDKETYFDFLFLLNEKDEITFRETGSLGQGFIQSHAMELLAADGDTLTFATQEKPPVLIAEVTADGNRLRLKVMLSGKPHVDLDMSRVHDDQVIAKFRAEQARAKDLPGGSAVQQFFAAAAVKTEDASLPKHEQAQQHLAQSNKLASQMTTASQSEIANLAFMMKGHLDRAIELDPYSDEAQFALATWYLQSRELAAKSKTKLDEILTTLEQMNSPLAEVLRQRLAAK